MSAASLASATCWRAASARPAIAFASPGSSLMLRRVMHIWADRYDSTLEDIFDLQDRVTSSVIGAISPQLERAEIERAQRKPTESLQAYDYYLRALASFYKFTREAHLEALKLTEIASGIDPEFAAAYALGARCYVQRKAFGWSTDAAQERIEARQLARRAIELDKDDPSVLAMAGHALAYVASEVEEGAALLSRAINLDANLAYRTIVERVGQPLARKRRCRNRAIQDRAAIEPAGSIDLQCPDRAGLCLFFRWPQRGCLIVGDNCTAAATKICRRSSCHDGMPCNVWPG